MVRFDFKVFCVNFSAYIMSENTKSGQDEVKVNDDSLEEGVINGGFGSSILELTNKLMPENCHKIRTLGLENKFEDKYGSQEELLKKNKLTVQNVIGKLI